MKHPIAFLHTSPAAIPPLMRFFDETAPEFEITNLLDDGLLRMLSAGRTDDASARLREMLDTAQRYYGVRAAMITCSSVSTQMARDAAAQTSIPVLKIDEPMARAAVQTGRRIGICATFRPTVVPTSSLLQEAARAAGRDVELIPEIMESAYDALLAGRFEEHDRILLAGVDNLASQRVDAIVLAQVSMARVLSQAVARTTIPVFSSLNTSLEALRQLVRD